MLPHQWPDKDVRSQDATEGISLDSRRSVLIVDRSEETREVLQTALERRGIADSCRQPGPAGLELARRHQPDLSCSTWSLEDSDPEAMSASLAERSAGEQRPLILLGSLRRPACQAENSCPSPTTTAR